MMSDTAQDFINAVFFTISTKPEEVQLDKSIVETDEGARYYLEHRMTSATYLHVLKILTETVRTETSDIKLFDNVFETEVNVEEATVVGVMGDRPKDVIGLLKASDIQGRIIEILDVPIPFEEVPADLRPSAAKPAAEKGPTLI